MDRIRDILGEQLNNAVYLGSIGINEYAWKYSHIFGILTILKEKKITILGGDVYFINEGIISPTYDSWYYKNDGEDNYENSYYQAIEYLHNFEKRRDNYIFTIVIK